MYRKLVNYLLDARDLQSINIALSKGGAMMAARTIDDCRPGTWEFSGFSQNGEDGILDVLRKNLLTSNRYSIEIGAADGLENNTAWLFFAEKFNGLMIEGNAELVAKATRSISKYSIGAQCLNLFVTKESVKEIQVMAQHDNPDVFSLDIDGNDYYIAEQVFASGFRPKIFVVEYNSVFGPDRSVTIEYNPNFVFTQEHPTHLYYGVSISAWRKFFDKHGYKFVTVDRNGVNGFFIDSGCFAEKFVENIVGLEYAENQAQYKKFGIPSAEQFEFIADQKFVEI